MKKFILLVSAWLGFATTATVHAQVESTPYAFTSTIAASGEEGLRLPARLGMQSDDKVVLYDNPNGFVLTEDTKMLKAFWPGFANSIARMSICYSAEWKVQGESGEETKTFSTGDGGRVEWPNKNWSSIWTTTDSYDLTTYGDVASENSISWILAQDSVAKIKITKITVDNFGYKKPDVVLYDLESLEVAGQVVEMLPAQPNGADYYAGTFTVVNNGKQLFSIAKFEIPQQYRGGYVRLDISEGAEYDWELNMAFDKGDAHDNYYGHHVKQIGNSYYYEIPNEATTMNPQMWKDEAGNGTTPWTVKVDGFYLTNGFDNSATYTDEYFPLQSSAMYLSFFDYDGKDGKDPVNAFDDATKQLTLREAGAAGWQYSSAQDFSSYEYAVVVMNEPAHDDFSLNFYDENTYWSAATENSAVGNGNLYASYKLDGLQKKVNEKLIDFNESGVYIACFWAAGWGQVKTTHSLSHVFLTNVLPDWEKPEVRTTTVGNYGTVCFEYPAVVSGAYIYTVEGKDAGGTTLYLKPYNGVLTAGVPYIYRSIKEGVNFYQIKSEEAKSKTPMTRNGLVGCLDTTVGEGGYALHTDNAWYKINAQVTFTNRAYLNLDAVPVLADEEAAAANVNRMVLGDWETTGIDEVKASPAQVDDEAVYNLSGIKMDADNLPKGIYIRGGKKFIVK